MIDIFERLAPAYGRVVRKLALDTWYDRANVNEFFRKADYFRRRYESELTGYFEDAGYRYNPRRIKDLSRKWLQDQILIPRKLVTLADMKKGKLLELPKMNEDQRAEVLQLMQGAKIVTEGRVSPVISFADNLEARAVQLGEDAAFDLGRELNSDTVQQNSDVYLWNTQEDKQVRPTHRKLAHKRFSYLHPPTTIDKYGRKHTGNPGTDWGCRCWETPATGKPLLDFVVRE